MTVVKVILFIGLFIAGLYAIEHPYMIELHEQGHLEGYAEEGISAWRHDFDTTASTKYSFNGLLGGYRAVYEFAFWACVVTFLICFRQYWMMGFALGLFTAAFYIPWEWTDFARDIHLEDMLWNTWIIDYGTVFAIVWICVIIFKFAPEIYYIATGNRHKWIFKTKTKNHPYKEDTQIQSYNV